MTTEEEDLVERLRGEAEAAKARAKEFEDKMMQAAMYGKNLLDKNIELEKQIEDAKQGEHEHGLRLQAKVDMERSLAAELEALREALKEKDQEIEKWKEEEHERNDKLRQEVREQEQEVEAAQAREQRLAELVQTLERQVEESNSALNRSVAGESFSAEYESVQKENITLIQEKQALEVELSKSQAELEIERANSRAKDKRIETQTGELESLQCEMSGYISSLESNKMEARELQAQLDAERNMKVCDEDGKGNSLFSEVEDRRQRVETQLSTLNKKYETMKESYDEKVLELQKVKMHNSQLLSIAGTRSDTEHVSRLEELLSQEKEKVGLLMKKLDTIDSLKTSGHKPVTSGAVEAAMPPVEDQDVSLMDTDTSDLGKHNLESSEYKYLAHLLSIAEAKNKEFQNELRKQVRQNMEESDKQRELCRKLHNHEQQINKLKADNYTLKIHIEELKTGNSVKGAKKDAKKRVIVEHIKFASADEEKENTTAAQETTSQFVLNEVTKHPVGSKAEPEKMQAPLKAEEGKDGKESMVKEAGGDEDPPKKRRGIIISDKVEQIGVDGEAVQADLKTEENGKKVERKPRAGRKLQGQTKVAVSEAECNQQ